MSSEEVIREFIRELKSIPPPSEAQTANLHALIAAERDRQEIREAAERDRQEIREAAERDREERREIRKFWSDFWAIFWKLPTKNVNKRFAFIFFLLIFHRLDRNNRLV